MAGVACNCLQLTEGAKRESMLGGICIDWIKLARWKLLLASVVGVLRIPVVAVAPCT